jgi:hypothetical protein
MVYTMAHLGFESYGYIGYWWSSTEAGLNIAWSQEMYADHGLVNRGLRFKEAGLSVRCVRL